MTAIRHAEQRHARRGWRRRAMHAETVRRSRSLRKRLQARETARSGWKYVVFGAAIAHGDPGVFDMASILVITSEEALASDVKRSLEERGHRVAVAAQRADGTRLLGDVGPDATLLHAGVADGGGSDLLRIRRRSDGTLTVELADEGLNFESVERAVIVEAFRRCNGSPTQAARLLGMTRDTMRYRIEKFGIAANES